MNGDWTDCVFLQETAKASKRTNQISVTNDKNNEQFAIQGKTKAKNMLGGRALRPLPQA
jgi:hypothetical protein